MNQTPAVLQKKICILGATGVGKTSLIKQYIEGIFSEKYHTSIGVKIDKKGVTIDATDIELMIWDIEGIDTYCGFNPRYLRGASGVILVADHTRISSLAEAKEIFAMVKKKIDVPILLAINKIDLVRAEKWQVNFDATQKDLFVDICHTSAKTGESVDSLFLTLAKHMVA